MMMKKKKLIGIFIVGGFVMGGLGFAAQTKARRAPAPQARKAPLPTRNAPISTALKDDPELKRALSLANQKNYEDASRILFNLSRNPKYFEERSRIKYILGLMFYEMKMYQVAAFQFVDVIRANNSKYVRQSLQKLSLVADELNDDTLLNYAIGKVNVDEFPKANQDMLRYRIGEFLMRKEKYDAASENLSKVQQTSPYYPKAKYLDALALAKANNLDGAMKAFTDLAEERKDSGITDTDRVAAVMGMARIAYQQKKFDLSIDLYRQVPRDTEIWHDSLFESSWAHMRAAHFRSVLSNLHSLHSPYYEDFYLPESILLRGIVYLYICQYDEMEKTLGLFEKIYQPVQTKLDQFTSLNTEPAPYFNEIEKMIRNFDTLKSDVGSRKNYKIPFLIARDIMKEGDFKHTYTYLSKLRGESRAVDQKSATWRRAPVGAYSKQILKGRIETSQKVAGTIVKAHMDSMKAELADLFEQYNFGKYEMLNGKKEALKKKIQGKGLKTAHVDDGNNRDFYIQNGFEYWPFSGEYWLDEIGDYHYLGTQGCE